MMTISFLPLFLANSSAQVTMCWVAKSAASVWIFLIFLAVSVSAYRLVMDPAQLRIVLKNLAGALVSWTILTADKVFNPLAAQHNRIKIFSGALFKAVLTTLRYSVKR
jgi:hypothetical protein